MHLIAGLLRVLGVRSSIENPSTTLREAADWLFDAWGGGPTISGVRVNRTTALGYSAVWRAVDLISSAVGKLPLNVQRRSGEGWDIDKKHPAQRLLRRKPNDFTVAFQLKRVMQAHALLQGNGYAYILRDNAGRPKELLLLDPEHCHPVRVNGKLFYIYDAPTSSREGAAREMRKLRAEDVLHIKGLGYDGLIGYSVLEIARQSLGMGIAARDYGARFFSGGGRPGAVIEHPGKLTKDAADRLRVSWESMYSGIDNAHKTAILEEGMKLHAFAISAKDAQLIESRQFEIREVANWFGVPPHKLGDSSRTAYNSLEQENQSYLDDCLDPWLVAWEEECWDKLLTAQEQDADTHTVEFKRQALVRANLNDRANYYRQATAGAPWLTPNEVRRLESMNELDSDVADELLLPLNMRPESEAADAGGDGASGGAGGAGSGAGQGDTGSAPPASPTPPAPPPPASPSGGGGGGDDDARKAREKTRSEAHRLLLADAAGRMARRLGTQARAAAGKHLQFRGFISDLEPKHRDTVIEALTGPMLAIECDPARAREGAITAAALLFDQVRSGLSAVYASEPKSTFAAAVERAVGEIENTFPLEVAKRFAGGPDAAPDVA